ncbi:LysR family transcriptional regulator [Nocardia huaxiensis]|uniref:LysR family transcriptional regulator n=1 Tax=Nocardia huaxiensis TaxID=2755382 RepID=A0A7D6V7Q3_9NOCA|nr:LysR family transcriptional regulator [Nocardia huaxiensis]QLY28734.1 LysR family transcriptional regulator [Nocardia huaxiensis]UFS97791.1 LysR family transcriptional regulator [Nocardia huaxiensis]
MDDSLSTQLEALAPLLAAFDTAADEGHITRAAQRLGVPQSSLSRRLKTVERTLGVQLFQPVGRGITLTPAGRELFASTREVMRALDDAVTVVRGNADPDSGLVRFGFPLSLGPVSIPALLADFHTAAPRIRLHLVQAHGEALADMVRDGRLDLAVMIPPPEDLPSITLGRQPIHLYVCPGHRLAGRTRVGPAELAGESFIANPPAYHLRRLLDTYCAAAGFTPDVAFEITEFETLRAFVEHGLGIALLPEPETPHPGLRRITLDDTPARDIGLASGNHRPTPAVARLHAFLVRHYAGVIN